MITKYDNWAENLSLNKGLLYTVCYETTKTIRRWRTEIGSKHFSALYYQETTIGN